MENILKNCKRIYLKLGIKMKLLILLASTALVVYSISFLTSQIVFHSYDEQLNSDSTQILGLYALNIENQLQKIDKFSSSIVTSNYVQENFMTVNSSTDEYEHYRAVNNLHDTFTSQGYFESYIFSVDFIDLHGNTYPFGASRSWNNPESIKFLKESLKGANGKILWLTPDDSDYILGIRNIVPLRSTNMESLGVLVVEIDPNQLFGDMYKISKSHNPSGLVVLSENKPIYKKNIDFDVDSEKIKLLLSSEIAENEYSVHEFNKQKYLTAAVKSKFNDWTFVYLMSYKDIFDGITNTRILMSLIFMLSLVLIIYLGYKFSGSIVNPIVALSGKMKKIESGNFKIAPFELELSETDEVHTLQKNFDIMIKKIDKLIEEDYLKQILISKTKYNMLQAQINPHFLYNTLETIKCLSHLNEQGKVSVMIDDLAKLLRTTLSHEDVITIEDELVILRSYVNIQKVRYEERLMYEENISANLKKLKIPKMVLQPLVENAINYALDAMDEPCHISVKSVELYDHFQITVEDNGPGVDKDFLSKLKHGKIEHKGNGIGLKNIDDRLKFLYGSQYGIYIASEKGVGTHVSLRMPKQGDE